MYVCMFGRVYIKWAVCMPQCICGNQDKVKVFLAMLTMLHNVISLRPWFWAQNTRSYTTCNQQCQQSCLKNTGSDWEDCGLWTAVLFLYNKISAFIKHNLWKSKKFLILFYHNSVACQHQITTSLGCIKLECFIFKTALWND